MAHLTKKANWLKLFPLVILLLALGLVFYFRLYEFVSFRTLQTYRTLLVGWVAAHPLLFALSCIAIYTLVVAISMPNAVILTIIVGFLVGAWLGTIYVIIGATLGAIIIFLAAKNALHDLFYAKSGPWLQKLGGGFQRNATSYMLFLRLVPLFPFWLVNIVPAFFGVRFRTFAVTTFIGIIPGTFIYTLLGNGLGAILDYNKPLDLKIVFQPTIFVPLLGLGILSLLPDERYLCHRGWIRRTDCCCWCSAIRGQSHLN